VVEDGGEDSSTSFKMWSIISIGTRGDAMIVVSSSPSLGSYGLDADRKRGITGSIWVLRSLSKYVRNSDHDRAYTSHARAKLVSSEVMGK